MSEMSVRTGQPWQARGREGGDHTIMDLRDDIEGLKDLEMLTEATLR